MRRETEGEGKVKGKVEREREKEEEGGGFSCCLLPLLTMHIFAEIHGKYQ